MISAGFDIGGTKCAVVIGKCDVPQSVEDMIIDKAVFSTSSEGSWQNVTQRLGDELDQLLTKHDFTYRDIRGIGISCGGPLDNINGVVLSPPNLPGWDAVPLKKIFETRFCLPVRLENDANACALAEYLFGASRGTVNSVFLTHGTGMGAGIIIDGKIYSGAKGMAGEVGHIRLSPDGPYGYRKRGSFEGWCSGGGIANLAKLRCTASYSEGIESILYSSPLDIACLTAKDVAAAAEQKDPVALGIMTESAVYLGKAISLLIDILAPDAIVLGSIYVRNKAFFDSIMLPVIKKEALPSSFDTCRILAAELGENVGDYAALGLVVGG